MTYKPQLYPQEEITLLKRLKNNFYLSYNKNICH